jgi:hypothetical protein
MDLEEFAERTEITSMEVARCVALARIALSLQRIDDRLERVERHMRDIAAGARR